MDTPLRQLAYAALDIDDLARGVIGSVHIEGVDAIREAQMKIVAAGWGRKKDLEGWTKLEHRVYTRGKTKKRWLNLTAGYCMGFFAFIEVTEWADLIRQRR